MYLVNADSVWNSPYKLLLISLGPDAEIVSRLFRIILLATKALAHATTWGLQYMATVKSLDNDVMIADFAFTDIYYTASMTCLPDFSPEVTLRLCLQGGADWLSRPWLVLPRTNEKKSYTLAHWKAARCRQIVGYHASP